MGDYIKCRSCESPYCKGCNLKRLEMMLENGKFDVAPVLHGRWNTAYKSGIKVDEGVVSTCCDTWNARRSRYCPNCGAKMDAIKREDSYDSQY